MICVSLQNKSLEEIQEILYSSDVEMAEIRLDRCPLTDEQIEILFSDSDVPLVATCRISDTLESLKTQYKDLDDKQLRSKTYDIVQTRLAIAIEAGAQYADLEMEAPPSISRKIKRSCDQFGTILIRSYHNYKQTPSKAELKEILAKCVDYGAELTKIVTTAQEDADSETIISLYDDCKTPLIAFCMGVKGKKTRLDCLAHGAPFTYAALSESDSTADGQWQYLEMEKALYGDRQFLAKSKEPLVMPSSKSFAQRAIIAAALADGVSHLDGYSPCGDNESAIRVAKAIGAEVQEDGNRLTIKGIGAKRQCLNIQNLNVGESGYLTRMMIPLLSVISQSPVTLNGEKTLLKRPLKGAMDIMASFGVRLSDIFVPLTVTPPAIPGKAEISGKDGSQLISGLLMALPLAEKDSTLYVTSPRSIPYMFITIDILKKFGIKVSSQLEGGEEFISSEDWGLCTGITFKIKGLQEYKSTDFTIEGDWSSAAPFLVAGSIFGEVELKGLDTKSLQADLSIMDVLTMCGASLSQIDSDEEGKGIIHVQKSPLMAFYTDANNCPDLFPVISVLAAFCEGESRISGIGRLAYKESDRAGAIVEMLTQMGVLVRIEKDDLVIEGQSLSHRLLTNNLLKGGKYTSRHDHRMVMALKVASLGADSEIEIDDTECVAKSFPAFNEMFDAFSRFIIA